VKKKEVPKGMTCECGEYTKYDMYVYAHWTVELVFTCPKCKAKYGLLEGVAEPKGRK